jgi:hypothetical protein
MTEITRQYAQAKLSNMKKRCYNQNSSDYPRYGGRGIRICNEWMDEHNGIMTFWKWCIEAGLTQENQAALSIERLDYNGDYTPSNCTFVDDVAQNRNKRNNFYITMFGETRIYTDWLTDERMVCSPGVWTKRIYDKSGRWDYESAFLTPNKGVVLECWGESKSLQDWAKDPRCKVSYENLKARHFKGFSPLEAMTLPARSRTNNLNKTTIFECWGESKTLEQWSTDNRCVVDYDNLWIRLKRGVPIEKAMTKLPRKSPAR